MWKFGWKTPPPTLHIYFADIQVAELERVRNGDQELFHFRYLPAFAEQRLAPLPGLPDLDREYWSKDLWAFFTERIPDTRRPEIEALLRSRRINRYDPLQMLAELGGRSITDPFEIRRAA